LIIVRDRAKLSDFEASEYRINTADESGTALSVRGTGRIGDWSRIAWSPGCRLNIVSSGRLNEFGYVVTLGLRQPRIVRDADDEVVLVGSYEHQMPAFDFDKLFALRRVTPTSERIDDSVGALTLALADANLADPIRFVTSIDGEESLKLWHRRLGHYPIEQIKAAYMRGLIRGVPVQRAMLSKKVKAHRCTPCDLAKASRTQHQRVAPDPFISQAVGLGDCIVCDTHLFMSIPARDGTVMMLNLTDVATRVVWNFRMQQKSDSLRVLKGFYADNVLTGKLKWKRFHSDSAGE
jgi:hypothetical protein